MRKFLAILSLLCLPATLSADIDVPCALIGDFDGDGFTCESGVTDIVYLSRYLFQQGPPPPCLAACDVNNDGQVDQTDIDTWTNFCFGGVFVEGFGTCQDVSDSPLDCEISGVCEGECF